MLTRKFARDVAERAASTGAQAALLSLGQDVLTSNSLNAFHVDWAQMGGFAAGGVLLTVLKSVAAGRMVGAKDSASLDPEA